MLIPGHMWSSCVGLMESVFSGASELINKMFCSELTKSTWYIHKPSNSGFFCCIYSVFPLVLIASISVLMPFPRCLICDTVIFKRGEIGLNCRGRFVENLPVINF